MAVVINAMLIQEFTYEFNSHHTIIGHERAAFVNDLIQPLIDELNANGNPKILLACFRMECQARFGQQMYGPREFLFFNAADIAATHVLERIQYIESQAGRALTPTYLRYQERFANANSLLDDLTPVDSQIEQLRHASPVA